MVMMVRSPQNHSRDAGVKHRVSHYLVTQMSGKFRFNIKWAGTGQDSERPVSGKIRVWEFIAPGPWVTDLE